MATSAERLAEARASALALIPNLTSEVVNGGVWGEYSSPEFQLAAAARLQALVATVELIDRLRTQ